MTTLEPKDLSLLEYQISALENFSNIRLKIANIPMLTPLNDLDGDTYCILSLSPQILINVRGRSEEGVLRSFLDIVSNHVTKDSTPIVFYVIKKETLIQAKKSQTPFSKDQLLTYEVLFLGKGNYNLGPNGEEIPEYLLKAYDPELFGKPEILDSDVFIPYTVNFPLRFFGSWPSIWDAAFDKVDNKRVGFTDVKLFPCYINGSVVIKQDGVIKVKNELASGVTDPKTGRVLPPSNWEHLMRQQAELADLNKHLYPMFLDWSHEWNSETNQSEWNKKLEALGYGDPNE